jgi:hypothetical protein
VGDSDNDGNCDFTARCSCGREGGGDLLRVEGAFVELEQDKVTFSNGEAYAAIGSTNCCDRWLLRHRLQTVVLDINSSSIELAGQAIR